MATKSLVNAAMSVVRAAKRARDMEEAMRDGEPYDLDDLEPLYEKLDKALERFHVIKKGKK